VPYPSISRGGIPPSLVHHSGEDGSAVIEFLGLTVVLMIPLVYFMLSVFAVQGAGFAVSAAVREAGRAYVSGGGGETGSERACAAARIVMGDHQWVPDNCSFLTVECLRAACTQQPGANIVARIRIDVEVGLPWSPNFGERQELAGVTVHAEHEVTLDRFQELPR
jgi:hypothetical protein